jgi:hypothetical protein
MSNRTPFHFTKQDKDNNTNVAIDVQNFFPSKNYILKKKFENRIIKNQARPHFLIETNHQKELTLLANYQQEKSSITLPPERATLGEPSTPTGRLAKYRLAVPTDHHRLRVTEHRGSAYIYLFIFF